MGWVIDYFPPCRQHVFLSHSREDHDDLVRPVFDRLTAAGVLPWIDRHHYPYGADSRSALQSSILACRHVVFFVTPALLASPRGWCVLELGYAEIVQANLVLPGEALTAVSLPLFFVPPSDDRLPRSVWQATRDRGPVHDATTSSDRTTWAASEIVRFLRREERRAAVHRSRLRRDLEFRTSIPTETGLRDRIARFDPQPIPEE